MTLNERFEGIVLFHRPYKEDDALVKIFTDRFGTKMFYLKHVKQGKHPLASHIIPLTCHRYIGRIQDQGLSFLKEGEALDYFKHNQEDFLRQAYAAYLGQLIDASIDDNQVDLDLYKLLKLSLSLLDQGKSPEIICHSVQLALLDRFGVALNFRECSVCGSLEGPFDFSFKHQGILCHHHYDYDPYRLHLSPRAVEVARRLSAIDLSLLGEVKVSRETLAELKRLMDEIYQEYVGIRLRAKSYLDQVSDLDQVAQVLAVKRQNSQDNSKGFD